MKTRLFCAAIVGCILTAGPSVQGASNLVLVSRTINWQAGISTQLVAQLNLAAGKPVPAFVKFNYPLSLTNHQLLQASGVQLGDYYRDASYAALLPSATFLTNTEVQALIFAAEHWLPSDKLRVPTSTNQLANWAYDPQSNTVNLLVGFWRSLDRSTITNDLASVGLTGIRYGADNSWAVVVPVQPLTNFVQILTNLATLLSVKVIQEGPLPYFPLNSEGRRCARTEIAQGFAFTSPTLSSSNPKYNKVSGNAVRIAICDEGIDESRNDFRPFIAAAPSRFYHPALPGALSGPHATHVASVALGNGYDSRGDSPGFRYRGHAPDARIGNYYTNFGANADLFYKAIHVDGTDVSNHSYVQSWTVYDLLATSLDEIVRGTGTASTGGFIPARPAVWGAGNNGFEASLNYDNEEGYYSVFTSAKNTISVGSVDTSHTPERLSWFSSLGPTFDCRIKPDVVAPGCRDSIHGDFIMAARYGTDGYIKSAGTSMAAPVVTGIIALMMHQYKLSFSVSGKLQPATYKALLIHTARDMIKATRWPAEDGEEVDWDNPDIVLPPPPPQLFGPVLYYEGPDFATGYGLVDAEAARAKIAESSHWGEGSIKATASSQTWCIDVPPGAAELKVVIAWDDEAGPTHPAPESDPKLVNDLDLVLKAPGGSPHLPWALAGLPRTSNPGDGATDSINPSDVVAAVRAADHTNNVEMVTVPAPAAGIWQAIVTGYDLPHSNSQLYSLVSSHPTSQSCPPPGGSPVPRKNICKIFPEICNPNFICIPKLEIFRRYIRFPMRCPVPISEICKYVINCPGCQHGPAWQLCPGFRMKVHGMPGYAVVIIFNDEGNILAEDSSERRTRVLTVPGQPPGARQFVLVMHKRAADWRKSLSLKFEFQPMDTPSSSGRENPGNP